MTSKEFYETYKDKQSIENALKAMSNGQIDELINSTPNIYAKMFFNKYKS